MMTNRCDPTPTPPPKGGAKRCAGHWVGVFALVLLSFFSAGDVAAQTPLVTKDARVKVQQGNNTLLTPVSQLLSGRVGATYNVAAYGIYPNGMDCRAALQALLDTMYNNGGGTLEFNSGTYRVSGRLKPKWTTACVGKSVPLKVTGTGAFMQGQLSLGVQAGGTILRYVGSDSILWDLRGVGLTEFTGLTMMDTTHGMTIFIRSTLNTVHVHDCSFFGDKSQYSADDIGIVLGSYKRGTPDGLCADGDTTINSGFQGYGTVIRDNFFNGISYGVWGRHNANGIHILNNTWWNNCGGWAAVRFGTNGNYNLSASNLISGNLIESSWYQNGIALYNSSKAIICENQFYDHTDTCDFDIYLDQYSTFCYVEAQFCNTDTAKIVRDMSGTATLFITEQNFNSQFRQGLRVWKNLEYRDLSTKSMVNVTSTGEKMYQVYQSSGVSQYVENSPPTAVKLFNVRDGGSNTRILELSGSSANYFDSPGDMRFRATGDAMYFSTNSNNNHGIVDGTFYAGLASTVNVMRMGQGDRVSWSSGSGPTNSESVGLTSTVAGTLRTVDASAADAPHQARDFQATGTSANQLPSGTTAQAPTPNNGQMRYDTDLGKLRAVVGGSWRSVQTDADALSGSGSNTQMTYWTGSNTLSGSNNLLYASSILQVKNSSTTTSFGATTANENIRLQNTDATPTNNNYSGISSYTQGGSIDAGIGFKHINHSTGESSIELFSRNSSGSFQRLASFANPTITFDKTVTMTSATTFSAGFTSNTTGPTFNAGFTVNTVAPTFNTNLQLGSSSVGSQLKVYNDYSSTSPATSTAYDIIHLTNRNSTNNNWASISYYAQGGSLAADVAAQFTNNASGYADLVFHTRGSSTSFAEAMRITSEKLVGIGVSPSVRLHVKTGSGATTAVQRLENSTGDADIFTTNATPEGAITGNPGDIAIRTDAGAGNIYVKGSGTGNTGWIDLGSSGATDHGALTGLSDDDHTQYALLAGRSGGQVLTGGTAGGDDITLRSTTNATKGDVILNDQGGNVTVGGGTAASELRFLEPSGSGTNYTGFKAAAMSGDRILTLPTDTPSDGDVLAWHTGDLLSWDAAGAGGGYATLRDDGVGATQRTIANFVSTSTVAATLTDDSGNSETEIALSIPTGGVTATEIAADAVGTSEIAPSAVTSSEIADATILTDDIAQNGATSGQVLTWNGTGWQPQSPAYPGANGHPSDLTANVNDYSPTNWATVSTHFLSGSGGIWTITGLDDLAGGAERTLVNDGDVAFVLATQHTGSAAQNRIKGTGEYMVSPGGSITLVYSDGNSRWLVKSTTFAPDQLGSTALGQYYNQTPGSSTAGDHPSLGFFTGGTAASNSTLTPSTGRPSGWQLNTGSTATGYSVHYYPKTIANVANSGDGHMVAQTTLAIPTLSTSSQRFTTSFGWVATGTSSALNVNNSVTVQCNDNVNSGKFELVTRDNAGSETRTDCGFAPVANTVYTITVVLNEPLTEARCYISTAGALPVLAAVNTANMPSSGIGMGIRNGIWAAVGTTGKLLNVVSTSGYVHY